MAGISESPFGSFEQNAVTEYCISNENGMQVAVINYGATVSRIITTDKNGNGGNIVKGFDNIEGYLANSDKYMGCIVGRFCNRIANAGFNLEGSHYQLAKNHQGNSLHGGLKGFDKQFWQLAGKTENSITFSYLSKDGEEGFPGNVVVTVKYTLHPDNALAIDYQANTDKTTVINLTNHSYFDLSAGKAANILDQELQLFADHYTALDENAIPTGEICSVINTGYNFTELKKIGRDIKHIPGGYDINFVLNTEHGKAAILSDPLSGRMMEMFTTEPGLQLYSGDHSAICLEAQHFPDSPNKPSFPSCTLHPADTYRQTTVYKFSLSEQ